MPIYVGPVDHPRGQGSVERAGVWIQDVLSKICKTWPTRWDEYVAPACWIKRTMPDPSLPSMTPFQLLFGRSPCTTLVMSVPQMDDTETTGGLTNFIENRRHNMRDVAEALPSAMTPFQLLWRRSLRTTLDTSVPQMDVTETTGGLTNFIENRRHNMRDDAEELKRIHESKVKPRKPDTAKRRYDSRRWE